MRSNVQIGYMNVHHQRVLSRARIPGDLNFSFIMWCSQCRQSYVARDGEELQCRCPYYDQGTPALVADDPMWSGSAQPR
jgi:hypothetical protein